jgi:hypothetical protein
MLTVFWLLAMRLSHALLADTAPVTVPPEKLVTSKFQLLTRDCQPGLPKEMVYGTLMVVGPVERR